MIDKLEALIWRWKRWRSRIPCWHGKIYRTHVLGQTRGVCAYCHEIFLEELPKGL